MDNPIANGADPLTLGTLSSSAAAPKTTCFHKKKVFDNPKAIFFVKLYQNENKGDEKFNSKCLSNIEIFIYGCHAKT